MNLIIPLAFMIIFAACFALFKKPHLLLKAAFCILYQGIVFPMCASDHPTYMKMLLGAVVIYDVALIIMFGIVWKNMSQTLSAKGVQSFFFFVAPWVLVVLVRWYCSLLVPGF